MTALISVERSDRAMVRGDPRRYATADDLFSQPARMLSRDEATQAVVRRASAIPR
jgi:hypothetical protein